MFLDEHRAFFTERMGTTIQASRIGDVVEFTYKGKIAYALVLNPDYEGKVHAVTLQKMPRDPLVKILSSLPSMHPFQFYHTYYATRNNLVNADAYRTYIVSDVEALYYLAYDVWGASNVAQNQFRWRRPRLTVYRRFIRRAEKRFNLANLDQNIAAAEIVPLTDTIWKNLNGTTSQRLRKGDVGGALRRAVERGIDFRAVKTKLAVFKRGGWQDAPIVLEVNNEYHLVTGELTLLFCKATKIIPAIVLVKVKQIEEEEE